MNLTRLGLPGLLITLLMLQAVPAHAQSIWKWRDKDGRMQMSDRPPPPEVADKDILMRPAAAKAAPAVPAAPLAASAGASSAEASPTQTDAELEARKRRAAQEQAAQRQSKLSAESERSVAIKADNCKRARSQMAVIDSGQRMSRSNEKGEREMLDDKGRADEAERARQIIKDNCS